MRVLNREAATIDYRLNLLGIRVWKDSAQLIAKRSGNQWDTIGPRQSLPVRFPHILSELSAANAFVVTAYQYDNEYPGSDLRAVLALEKDFDKAIEISLAVPTAI
jgi:hypothetical protein